MNQPISQKLEALARTIRSSADDLLNRGRPNNADKLFEAFNLVMKVAVEIGEEGK